MLNMHLGSTCRRNRSKTQCSPFLPIKTILDSFLDSIDFNISAHKTWEIYSRFRVNEASNLLIQEVL